MGGKQVKTRNIVFLSWFVGGLMGAAAGVAMTIFVYPYVFPPPPAMEALEVPDKDSPVATGSFIHANPADPIHYGKGEVTVYDDVVFLGSDFEVGPGPAFHVFLVPKAGIRESSDVRNTMYVDLGKLRAFEGSQNYRIPDGVDLRDYPSVVIWCAQFGVLISPADLRFES